MDLRCELSKNECCIYLPGVPQTERKGRKDRSESARRTGLRILGPVQKTGMVNIHLVVHKTHRHFSSMEEQSRYMKSCRFESDKCHHPLQPKCVWLQEDNQLIVLEYEHA